MTSSDIQSNPVSTSARQLPNSVADTVARAHREPANGPLSKQHTVNTVSNAASEDARRANTVNPEKSILRKLTDALVTRLLKPRFQHIVRGFEEGQLNVLWPDGSVTLLGSRDEDSPGASVESASVEGAVEVHMKNFDPVKRMALHGSIGWAESYMDGHWDTNEIFDLFMLFLHNEKHFPTAVAGSWVTRLRNAALHRHNKNTLDGSRRNIARHYDLGNEFYKLWLDESMSYSSAFYSLENETLAQAQQNKIDKVLEKLNAAPGARVLEIGCGWGATAATVNAISACSVTGISLSREQLQFARKRYQNDADSHADSGADTHADEVQTIPETISGVETPVASGALEFLYCDYREMHGKFDHIVSIEMFEAVGREYWSAYFSKLNELLTEDGTAVLQIITIAEDRFEDYSRQPDFIQKYIFPGGMLATKSQLDKLAAEHEFEVTSVEYFGKSYARTLREWRLRFEDQLDSVRQQGFDERFIRMWRYYLAYCEAGFTIGSTDVGLWVLRRKLAS